MEGKNTAKMNVIRRIKSILTGGTIILLLLAALLPAGCRSKTEESEELKPAAGPSGRALSSRQTYAKKGIRPKKALFSRKIED